MLHSLPPLPRPPSHTLLYQKLKAKCISLITNLPFGDFVFICMPKVYHKHFSDVALHPRVQQVPLCEVLYSLIWKGMIMFPLRPNLLFSGDWEIQVPLLAGCRQTGLFDLSSAHFAPESPSDQTAQPHLHVCKMMLTQAPSFYSTQICSP